MPAKIAVVCGLIAALCSSCSERQDHARAVTGGNIDRGATFLASYGCGSCHIIPGIPGARGVVGPALSGLGDRLYVAGKLPNQTENLMRWIENPQSLDPGTAMPNLGVTDKAARDIAAYLYSIK